MGDARDSLRPHMRVDWPRVLVELDERGMSTRAAAKMLGIGKRTVGGWKHGVEPRHCNGEELVELWCDVCEKTREDLPMVRLVAAQRA